MKHIIDAKRITLTQNNQTLLNRINVQVREHQCFGILGRKNSGAKELLHVLSTLTAPDSGELFIFNLDARGNPDRIRSKLGFVSKENALDLEFKVTDSLAFYAQTFGYSQREALFLARKALRVTNLDLKGGEYCSSLSPFELKCLAISRAVLLEPSLIIFEEPTERLEREEKEKIWEMIQRIKGDGTTMVIWSSYRPEIEALCTEVALVDSGRVVHSGLPRELVHREIGKEVLEFSIGREEFDYYSKKMDGNFEYKYLNGIVYVFVKPEQDRQEALKILNNANVFLREPSLKDVFLKVTGQDLGGVI